MMCDVDLSSVDKIQLKVYIRKKTIDSFKQFLSQKWQTYGRGLLSLEVEQAMKHYISNGKLLGTDENREHTRTIDPSEIMQLSHTMKGRKPKPRQTYSIEELNQLKATLLSVADLIDKKIKGEKIERDHKERMKAPLLKDEIVEWLVHNGKFESKESIKLIPISLVRQAIGAIKKITDMRSINNHIEYLKTYKQIDQTGLGGKQFRFVG
jgi:hypothetical protein